MESKQRPATQKDLSFEEVTAFVEKVKYLSDAQLSKVLENQSALDSLSNRSKTAVANELQRIRQECDRSIDLRYKVKSLNIHKVNIANITHFLDDSSISLLNEEILRYSGKYTIGAYEQVKRVFEKQKSRLLARQELADQKIKQVQFGRVFVRSEERMNLALAASLYRLNLTAIDDDFVPRIPADTKAIKIVTSNISRSALKVKADVGIEKGQYVALSFDDIEKEFIFKQSLITYEVQFCRFNPRSEKYEIILTISSNHANQEFQQYVNNLIYSHKFKYKVDLATTIESVLTKSLEQTHVSSNGTMHVLYDDQNKIKCCYGNQRARDLFDKFSVAQNTMLDAVLKHSNVKERLQQQSSITIFFARVKRGKSANLALISGVVDSSEKSKAMLSRLKDAKHVVFCKVSMGKFSPSDADKTSTVPVDARKDYGTDQIYHTSEQAKEFIEDIQHVVSFAPVLQNDTIKVLASSDNTEVDSSYFMALPETGLPLPKFVGAEVSDLRIEDRYLMSVKVTVSVNGKAVTGKTTNISSYGLCVKMDERLELRADTEVLISFVDLAQRSTLYRLTQCKYKVVHSQNYVVRLDNKNYHEHDARQFFAALIQNRINELNVCGKESQIHGLTRLLRNGVAKHTPNCQLFTTVHKNLLSVSALNVCDRAFTFSNSEQDIGEDVKAWLYNNEVNDLVQSTMQVCIKEDCRKSLLLVLSVDNNVMDGTQASPIKSAKVVNVSDLSPDAWQNTLRIAKFKQRQAKIFELQLNKPGPELLRYYRDELKYVKRFAPHKFKELRDTCRAITGYIEVIELTDSLL